MKAKPLPIRAENERKEASANTRRVMGAGGYWLVKTILYIPVQALIIFPVRVIEVTVKGR